jgi:hypothetical protein
VSAFPVAIAARCCSRAALDRIDAGVITWNWAGRM